MAAPKEKPFDFEFTTEIAESEAPLWEEANERLRALREGHDDIVDAAVTVEDLTGSETPHRYQARVVLYMRPDNIVGVEKAPDAMAALQSALDVVERQVRKERAKRREKWKRP
jgi:ribosome-associated translation inhibitor RaiA